MKSAMLRRVIAGLVSCVALAGVLAMAATPALAAHKYLTQITGVPPGAKYPGKFTHTLPVAIDRNNHVWIADVAHSILDPRPPIINEFDENLNFIRQTDADGHFGLNGISLPEHLVFDFSNDYLYGSSLVTVEILKNTNRMIGHFVVLNAALEVVKDFQVPDVGYKGLTIDNSGSPSSGRIYALVTPLGGVRSLDADGNPVLFAADGEPGTGSYIEGSLLKGTPTQQFEAGIFGPKNMATDSDGNLWVVDVYRAAKFAPSGKFLLETPLPYALTRHVATDPRNNHVFILDADNATASEYDASGNFIGSITGSDTPQGTFGAPEGIAVDNDGRVFITNSLAAAPAVNVFAPEVVLPEATYANVTEPTATSGTLHVSVDPNGGGPITGCAVKYGPTNAYESSKPCSVPTPYAGITDISAGLSGLAPETTYHYRVELTNSQGTSLGGDATYTPHRVLGLRTEQASQVGPISAQLNASFLGNGDTTRYYFEWGGPSHAYGHKTAVPPGDDAGSASGPQSVNFEIDGLRPVTTYHYRVVAKNSAGVSVGEDKFFTTDRSAPLVTTSVSDVHTNAALLHGTVNPGGAGPTSYHFEFGPTAQYGSISPDGFFANTQDRAAIFQLNDLQPGATYHYRLVAENTLGETVGPDQAFTTYPELSNLIDPCPNQLARQQTGAAMLLDCRAYELVSAGDASGYDVESDLVPGQKPYPGFPLASGPSRVLYSVDSGAISGTGRPTNRGQDAYVATRGESGWSTAYVGVPASPSPSLLPFSSTLGEAGPMLTAFAFAGPGLCAPCFEDGKTGIPVRLTNGSLVQGMAGSLDPGPTAKADILVRRRLSSDGRYLVFGSTDKFEEEAPSGQPAIYKRDLDAGTTKVVSKAPAGTNIPCLSNCTTKGLAGLDISDDGSRVLVGQLLGTDAEGNNLWHPYMNVDGASTGIDLAPGTTSGVSYAGMTGDGSKLFFASADPLTAGDTDTSADLFEVDVSGGTATLTRLTSANSDACNPPPNFPEPGIGHWNSVSPNGDCSVVPIGGGGGVAEQNGTIYFLSPELLDGAEGTAEEPNLYALRPSSPAQLVATLEPDNPAVLNALHSAEDRNTANFQVTPSGNDAVFTSTRSLTGYDNAGHRQVYRYHAPTEALDCVSCASFTGVQATVDAALASNGRSLTDDGRVFFTTAEALSLNDSNNRKDVYEWNNGEVHPPELPDAPTVQLVSTGVDTFDSSLLSVSADGLDAYFYTRETLVSEDRNGATMKIYDARERGGFFVVPPPPPCVASDECHGPGSQAPGQPAIRTPVGTPGNARNRCRPGKVRRKNRCVKKKHRNPRTNRGRAGR